MLGMMFYVAGCFVASAVLTFLLVVLRPIEARDEMRSWRTWLVMFVLTIAGPYIYADGLTRYVGPEIADSVDEAVWEAGVEGRLQYYRIVKFDGEKARVIAVSEEDADWGGTERPVVAMSLGKGKHGWEVESVKVVNSDSRNADGWTFPPFF